MTSPNRASASPDYERPPVVETVLGVQFDRLPKFGNAHLGTFWKSLDTDEWPNVADAPPLATQFEQFGDAAKWAKGFRIELTQDAASRLQIKNRGSDRMIQVQNGRLHFNWLGKGSEHYLRYARVRTGFEEVLKRFVDLVARENMGDVRPNQWEVTYVNQIPKGTVWNSPADWGFFRPLAGLPTVAGLANGESFNGEWHFTIPERRGRLHVQWQHGTASDKPEREIITLTLTARGPVAGDNSISETLGGLDLGHETIVHSFASLMTKAANDYWGLKNG